MTIFLACGDISRFAKVGNFASYARCVLVILKCQIFLHIMLNFELFATIAVEFKLQMANNL